MTNVTIVVAYNTQVEMTKKFLDTIAKYDKDMNIMIDLVLVHGYVGDEEDITHPLITKFVKLKNEGFCKTLNAGLKAIDWPTDYIFMVGNDSFPRDSEWLPKLIKAHKDTGAALICPCDQKSMETRSYHKETGSYRWGYMYPSIAYLIPIDTFKTIGYLDERFTGAGYYADDDYCRRIRGEYGDDSLVLHTGVVLDHLISQEGKSLNVTNQMGQLGRVFREKWEKKK